MLDEYITSIEEDVGEEDEEDENIDEDVYDENEDE